MHAEGNAGLWHDPDLALALRWRDTNRPNAVWAEHCHPSSIATKYVGLPALAAGVYDRQFSPDFHQAMAFIDASKAANEAEIAERENKRRRDVRRTRIFATVLGIAFLISLGFGVFAFDARNKAYAARNEAVVQRNQAEVARKEAVEERGKAVEERRKAEIANAEAQHSAEVAEKEKQRAEEAAKIADQQRIAAVAASERARQAQVVAEQRRQEAERSALESLRAAMRVRKQSLNDKTNINTLAERLIQIASPEEAAYWRNYYATSLAEIGRSDLSKNESTKVLEIFGDNLNALTNRGYMSLIRFETQQALKDFERIRELDPKYSLNYLNLGVTQANLKDYSGAENSIQKAIEWYRPGYFDGVFDSEVSDDIKQATHRNVIYADGNEFNAALYYELASLEAFRGGRDFEAKLSDADRNAAQSGSSMKVSYRPQLGVMQQRKEPSDYGAWRCRRTCGGSGLQRLGQILLPEVSGEHDRNRDVRYGTGRVGRSSNETLRKAERAPIVRPRPQSRCTNAHLQATSWPRSAIRDALGCWIRDRTDPTTSSCFCRARATKVRRYWAAIGAGNRRERFYVKAREVFRNC